MFSGRVGLLGFPPTHCIENMTKNPSCRLKVAGNPIFTKMFTFLDFPFDDTFNTRNVKSANIFSEAPMTVTTPCVNSCPSSGQYFSHFI